MAKVFYDHLISLNDILAELDQYNLSHDEKVDIVRTVDTTIHYHVVDAILTHLPKEKHQQFLKSFHRAPHDKKHLLYLKKHKQTIEEEMLRAIKKAKTEILSDLKMVGKADKTSVQ